MKLTDTQIRIFEKYYSWGQDFIQNWDINGNDVIGVYFQDLSNCAKILKIYPDGLLAIHHDDANSIRTRSIRPAFMGFVSEETMDKIFKLKAFI